MIYDYKSDQSDEKSKGILTPFFFLQIIIFNLTF